MTFIHTESSSWDIHSLQYTQGAHEFFALHIALNGKPSLKGTVESMATPIHPFHFCNIYNIHLLLQQSLPEFVYELTTSI